MYFLALGLLGVLKSSIFSSPSQPPPPRRHLTPQRWNSAHPPQQRRKPSLPPNPKPQTPTSLPVFLLRGPSVAKSRSQLTHAPSPFNSPAVPSGPMQPAASRDYYTAGKPANGDACALPRAGTVSVDVCNANAYFFPSLGSHQIVHQTIRSRGRKDMKMLLQMEKEAAELQTGGVSPTHLPHFHPSQPSRSTSSPTLTRRRRRRQCHPSWSLIFVLIPYIAAVLATYWPK